MLRGTDTENGIDASVCALVKVVSKLNVRPPETLIEIVLSPRLSFASTWNAITVSTELPPLERETEGGDLSASVFVVVDSAHAPAMTTSAVAAAAAASDAKRLPGSIM
jgi:hypothetical protein